MMGDFVAASEIYGGDARRTCIKNGVGATIKEGAQEKLQNPSQASAKETQSGPLMTKKFLKDLCKQHKLYSTPCLNDTLYLHFKGFSTIENLEEYTGLKCLWLESNGLQRIENLHAQTDLRCLFLQQNLIYKLENLEPLKKLCSLNVSNNYIRTIENISCLPDLSTLQIAHNKLETVGDVEHLSQCLAISVLDMSHNLLNDPEIITVLEAMSKLRVLNLMGNEVVKKIPNYRKTMIVRLKQLTFLDDRPVFPKDRACAEAWAVGGMEGERKEREHWETRERRKIQDSLDAMEMIRNQALERQRLRDLQEKGETEVSTTPYEQNDTQFVTSSHEAKLQACVQDTLDAHEEFLQSQTTQWPSDHQPNCEHLDAEPPDQDLQKEQLVKNNQLQSVREQKEGGNPDLSAREEESTTAEMLQRGQVEIQSNKQQKHSGRIQFILSESENEQGCMLEIKSEQCEKKQPHLVREAPPKGDEVAPVHYPGPLVTELHPLDVKQLETIHLPLHQSLCIDDLPDLEDVDTEDFTAMVSSQQVVRPKIEVISGSSDESLGSESEVTPMFSPNKSSLFTEVSNNSSSLLYPEDCVVLEPQIFKPVGKSKSSPSSCLIEELD
uniref:Uncharacterized protein n=1 Tax=Monopterus albus TaxID=43700 RepID=A0A3Q3J517_MONAL|nr:dynein assembly factor 1, axonemal [Monopterus albus]